MSLIRWVARPMLAAVFVAQGARTLLDPEPATVLAKPVTDRMSPAIHKIAPQAPSEPRTLVRANAAVHVGAGLLLATGRFPRISSLVLAASLVPTTIAGHAFWNSEDPAERDAHRLHFLKNVGLAGGLLVAGVDTEGKPGLAWRAKDAAGDSRRAIRHAAGDSRSAMRHAAREARLTARAKKAEMAHKVESLR